MGPAALLLLLSILQGTVSDAGRHGIRAAKVRATNLETHAVCTTNTGHDGKYELQLPSPGTYSISIKASGFEELAVKDPVRFQSPEEQRTLDLTLKPKAVQEFQVMNGDYNAQIGRAGGINVNLMGPGGGAVHGALYDNFRNSALDASTFQNNRAGLPKSLHIFNNHGLVVNGPLRKDKAFYTLNYEGLRDMTPLPKVATIPTLAERRGDFSQSPVTINGFPGNVIPPSRLNPVARNILAAMPAPNLPGTANNYLASGNASMATQHTVNGRLDISAGKKHRFFGAVNRWVRDETRNDNGLPGILMQGSAPLQRSMGAIALDWVYMRNPTTMYNIRFAASRYVENDAKNSNEIFDFTKFGFARNFSAPTTSREMTPVFYPAGYTPFGQNNYTFNPDNAFGLQANMLKISGRHQIRSGLEARVMQSGRLNIGNPAGWFSFDPSLSGNSIASLLLGLPSAGGIDYNDSQFNSWRSYAFWMQDDWRFLSRINLSLGWRWDIEGPLRERFNRVNAGFDPNVVSPANDAVRAAYAKIYPTIQDKRDLPSPDNLVIRGGLLFPGVDGHSRDPYHTYPKSIQPRLGVAVRLTNKTVMRAGIGAYYTQSTQFGYTAGFQQSTSYLPPNTLTDPFPRGIAAPSGNTLGLLTNIGQQGNFDNPNRKLPRILQFSAVLQRELRGQMNLDVAYVGNQTHDFFTIQNLNEIPLWAQLKGVDDPQYLARMMPNPFLGIAPPTTALGSQPYILETTFLRAFPEFESVNRNAANDGKLWYNSLQAKVNKRFSKSLVGAMAYVYSKSMERYEYQNQWAWDRAPARAAAANDIPHSLILSFQYEPPLQRLFRSTKSLARRLTSGWQIQETTTYASGQCIGITGAEYTGAPVEPVEHRWVTTPSGESVMTWFNTYNLGPDGLYSAARSLPETIGEALAANSPFYMRKPNQPNDAPLRLSSIRAPAVPQLNIAFVKDTKVTERTTVQFRADSYNLTNSPLFPGPNTDVTNRELFGTVPAYQVNAPRNFQLALRLTF